MANNGNNQGAPRQSMMIPRARTEFRGVDESLFTPLMVTIGPYHRRPAGEEQRPRDNEKREAAEEMCRLLGETRWTELREKLSELESSARACYPDGLSEMQLEEFSTMLLRDGCYVLRFLDLYSGIPRVVNTTAEEMMVMRDILFLLENQIPWFVLRKMHCCIMGDPNRTCANEELAARVRELLKLLGYISGRPRPSGDEPAHLLHLVHHYLTPTEKECRLNIPGLQGDVEQGPNARRMGRWPRATQYRYTSVRLKPLKLQAGEVDSILDVCFNGRTLWIPPLRIDGHTWTILRNLMALEEQMPRRPVTAYCIFMSQLVCKAEDVVFLESAEILQHFEANDEAVAQGFANLCKQAVIDVDNDQMNYLKEMWRKLDAKHKQVLEILTKNPDAPFLEIDGHGIKINYIRFIAAAGAIVLFFLQLAQVIIAVISIPKEKK